MCLLAAIAVDAQTEAGIRFEHGAWKETLAKAKKENKLVMLDAYTSWCGPCKWMAKNIFPLKEVGDFYNKHFINAKIDMEKGEGTGIAKQYNVMNYPTFLFVDGSGKLVHRVCGSREAKQFIEAGEHALNVEKCFATLEQNYRSNSNSAGAALAYFNAASDACMDVEQDVNKYLGAQPPASLTEKGNFDLLMSFVNDVNATVFTYLLEHYNEFTSRYDKAMIDGKIRSAYSAAIKYAIRGKDEKQLASVQKAYRAQAQAPVDYLDAFTDVTLARAGADTSLYFKAIIRFTDKYQMNNPGALNAAAWDFYEKTENKSYLLKAEAWARSSVELEPAYANMDTYAAVLYKLGKYQEAKATAIRAIEFGRKANDEVKETEKLLEKINGKLKA